VSRIAPPCALLVAVTVGCYQPRPLDARAVMNEVAAEARAPAATAKAPTGGAAPVALSEDEAVALALRSNPDLRAARHQRGVADGELVAAGALANPTVDFDFIHIEDYGSRRGWAVALGWEPPQPGIYSARRAAARAQVDAVVADLAEAEAQLANAVRGAHAALLAIGEKRRLVEQAISGRRQIAALVGKRVNGGASTRLDLGLADLATSQVERDRDELAAQEIAATAQLAALLGTAPPDGVTGTLPTDVNGPPALEPLVEAALAARPALVAEEKRFAVREETLRLEHARSWPWFRLTAIPRYRSDASDVHPNDFAMGLQLTLPIFNQNGGPIRVAEATRDQERELFRKQLVDLRRDIEGARAQVALRSETLRRYETSLLPALDAQEKLLATSMAGGQLDVVAILQAADVILRSRRDAVDVRLACYRARLDLERAVGRHPVAP
jgi:cobalt-zinc-cadmium efflux system outer membrane protein